MHRLELKIPPAALVLLFAWAMWLVARAYPWAAVQIPANEWIACGLGAIGFAVVSAAIRAFISAKTTANPFTPGLSSSLVIHGVYKLSRNPMYGGFFIMLLAWGVFLENILSVLLLPLFVLYLTRFQIIPEENVLRLKFGEDYARYLKSVRRWI